MPRRLFVSPCLEGFGLPLDDVGQWINIATMPSETLNVEAMLRSAFMKAELDFLRSQPRFCAAILVVKTNADFIRLCELGSELLKMHKRANPAASQLRESRNDTQIRQRPGEN